MDAKALKVKIKLMPNGHADYPNFNDLPIVQASGVDWSYYIERHGLGWAYDKQSGHADNTLDSPRGEQWGVVVVEPNFAEQSVAAFPEECSIINEVELANFWETRAHAHIPDDDVDYQVIDSLKKQTELLEDLETSGISNAKLRARLSALKNRIKKAVDPDDPEPGVKKNSKKKWDDYKSRIGVVIVP